MNTANTGFSQSLLGFPTDRSHSETIIRPNKEISVFRVRRLKILGRVGTHILF